MNINVPFTSHGLKDSEVSLLKKGNFKTVSDLIITPIQDIAKRCKASPIDVKRLVDTVLGTIPSWPLERLDNLSSDSDEKFSTGDAILDKALGGGIRTGMLWEVVGESSAGKTQLALQLSLFVQAPPEHGGLSASCCYLTTSAKLPTKRLDDMVKCGNPVLSTFCGLNDVHTISVPTVEALQYILTTVVPTFIQGQASTQGAKPVRLLVIDALGELFHTSNKTTSVTLINRSKDIANISTSLHELANVHKVAVIVLNEVIDKFDQPSGDPKDYAGVLYNTQSRWFSTAEFFGERAKEATLGLVWANQVNTRIMLTRTGRRKYFDEDDLLKRRRINESSSPGAESSGRPPIHQEEQQSVSIRRLAVIFSNVASPVSLDYIITMRGLTMLEAEVEVPLPRLNDNLKEASEISLGLTSSKITLEGTPASVPAFNAAVKEQEDDDDDLWVNYEDYDYDAMEQTLSQLGQ